MQDHIRMDVTGEEKMPQTIYSSKQTNKCRWVNTCTVTFLSQEEIFFKYINCIKTLGDNSPSTSSFLFFVMISKYYCKIDNS